MICSVSRRQEEARQGAASSLKKQAEKMVAASVAKFGPIE
jgi:hypothetical protein